jgi:hypothetical protein
MKIASHIEKFERLDAVRRRLDPVADRELWIWTAMNACTHLLNAALHWCGVTEEFDSFHSQVEGQYAIPDRDKGTLSEAQHRPGDLMHVDQPPVERPKPPAVERACTALKIIEDLREAHVRRNQPIADGAAGQWERAYAQCVAELSAALGISVAGAK